MRNSSISRESQSTSRRRSSTTTTSTSQSTRRSSVTTATETNASAAAAAASSNNNNNTIALFGAGSPTATHFLRLALDAGYHVRALLVQSDHALASRSTYPGHASRTASALKEEFYSSCMMNASSSSSSSQQQLEWVRAGSVYDAAAVAAVVQNATYVVCMMNHPEAPLVCEGEQEAQQPVKYNAQKKAKAPLTPDQPLTSFLQVLYPLMRQEESIRVFLYQVSNSGYILYYALYF